MSVHPDRNILKDSWRKFALRAQNLKYNNSPAFIQMAIIVDAAGNPVFWLEPRVRAIEPRLDFDFTSLETKFTKEQLRILLSLIAREG